MMPPMEKPEWPKSVQEIYELVLNKDAIKIIGLLYEVFKDSDKVRAWLFSKNLNFGGFAPAQLISMGRTGKVIKFIMNALEENKPASD